MTIPENTSIGSNLEDRIQSSDKSFEEIPIWLPSSYGGFGDIMVTLKLAEGLKQEFPDKKVTVYFGKESDYQKVKRIHPDFNPDVLETDLNGISVAQVTSSEIQEIMSKNLVGIYSPIPAAKRSPDEQFFMDAKFNFYIEEYDASDRIDLPIQVIRNQVYQDDLGREHLVLPTGFQEDSIGVHIDSSLLDSPKEVTVDTKIKMLSRSGFNWVREHIPNLLESEWTMAYYGCEQEFRDGRNSYLSSLDKSLEEKNNKERPIVVFDFSPHDSTVIKRAYRNRQFNEIFLEEDGNITKLEGEDDRYHQLAPNVYIVHVGPQEHATFLDFLQYSELPAQITGDCSLAEAISMNKAFIYNAPAWKGRVLSAFVDLAENYLDNWRDANMIRSLLGRDEVKEENINNYPEVENFYLSYRTEIHKAKDLESENYDKGNYSRKAQQLFGEILKKEGNKESYKLTRYFEKHHYSFSMAYHKRAKGIDKELEILKRKHVFGIGAGYASRAKTQRMFDDPNYHEALHKLNQVVIDKLNISRNLANLIRKTIQE
ncbi:hypothetical protein HOA92_06430 [archaeon]|jgi:hypothetical protein|nr:hypothetical protein [archaeon]MBT6762648.1 hypothetical protein [archaeon]